MNIDIAIHNAKVMVNRSIDLAAQKAIDEIHFIAELHRQILRKRSEHYNRSAGQRRRYAR